MKGKKTFINNKSLERKESDSRNAWGWRKRKMKIK